MYIWEKPDWPNFTWDETSLSKLLAHVSREQGRLLGKMEALGFDLRNEAHLRTLTEPGKYFARIIASSRPFSTG